MILDTSAIIAILWNEAEASDFIDVMAASGDVRMSAANYLEAGIVIDGLRNPILSRRLDESLRVANVQIEPVTEIQAELARQAYKDFGKGSGHPAGLNFGDCFAYALSKDLAQPLLFKGNDFAETDVDSALA